jgi:hypothetical protein
MMITGQYMPANIRALCRLLDFKTQEKYYTKIMERYMNFCSDSGQRDELWRRFSSLEIRDSEADTSTTLSARLETPASTKALTDVLMALRKLREGIVASKRADDFSIQAYLFNIRLSVLVKQPESYQPAILHLLRKIHPKHPLTTMEEAEVVTFLVLDMACRLGELAEAFAMRRRWKIRDAKVAAALRALVHDNYVAFQRVKRSMDGHKAKLMEWAEPDMRLHTLKCFGRSYLTVDLEFLERTTVTEWKNLTKDDGVGWELDGSKVVIRKVRTRQK